MSGKLITNSTNTTNKKDESCQTLSTGNIVITNIFFTEEAEKNQEKVLTSSPKKEMQKKII